MKPVRREAADAREEAQLEERRGGGGRHGDMMRRAAGGARRACRWETAKISTTFERGPPAAAGVGARRWSLQMESGIKCALIFLWKVKWRSYISI